MILRSWGPQTAYRMHTPRWATDPTSGAGAALHGGRANRKGLAALYLSLDSTTAVAEYQQLSKLMPPGPLVSYTVRLESIVDFSGGFDADTWSPLWEDFGNDDFEEIMSTHYGRMVVLDDRIIMFANPEDAAEYIGFDLTAH